MAKISITKEHNGPEQDIGEFREAGIRFGRSLDERILPGARITSSGHEVTVELQYPERDGHLSRETICVDLCDVRASSGFKARYDFERDGWSITMDRTKRIDPELECLTEIVVKDQEVAFIPAWNEEPEGPEEDHRNGLDPAETAKLAQALVSIQEAAIIADPVHGRAASTMAALMLAITALCEATGTSPAAIGKRMLELAATDLVPR